MTRKFKVELLEEANEFLRTLDDKTRKKIIYNLRKAQVSLDDELFKKLTDTVWEFRTLYKKTKYRLFAFWDKTDKTETLVICTHGVAKKTSKTPQKEIAKTEQMMKVYFNVKRHNYEKASHENV